MKDRELGELLEAFVNVVSHPRGRALDFFAKASVTVDQAILMNFARTAPGSTPSSLAATMNLSLPSVSQMIDRLVKLAYLERTEDPSDRRRKTITVTAKGISFLTRLRAVRSAEFEVGTAHLRDTTRRQLSKALEQALAELVPAQSARRKE